MAVGASALAGKRASFEDIADSRPRMDFSMEAPETARELVYGVKTQLWLGSRSMEGFEVTMAILIHQKHIPYSTLIL